MPLQKLSVMMDKVEWALFLVAMVYSFECKRDDYKKVTMVWQMPP